MALLFMAPAVVAIVATLLFPIVYDTWLSLHRFNLTRLYEGQRFVGLDNYVEALTSEHFYGALRNTLVILAGTLVIEMTIGFGLALLLHRYIAGRRFFQIAFLLPLLLVPAVVGYMWRFMLQYDGIVNYLLSLIGLAAVDWSTTEMGLLSVIVMVAWQNTPFALIIFLAALQSIDPEVDAAAQLDGAGSWARIRFVTLPLIKPFILLVLVIRTMDLLRLFDEGYVLTRGGPGRSTETLSQLVYTNSFTFFDIGRGASLSIIQAGIIVGFIVVYFLLLHRESGRATN